MTLNKLYKKGSKDKQEELTNSEVRKPSSPTRVPWWASFSKKVNKTSQTTTVKETTTEAYKPISSTQTNIPYSNYIQYGYTKVFKKEKFTNIVGKLLNVTGKKGSKNQKEGGTGVYSL